MRWIRSSILTILIVITLYVAYHHYFVEKKSKFWRFQPVTRKKIKQEEERIGDIVDNPLSEKHISTIKKCQFEKVENISDWPQLVTLLDNHYIEGVKYSEPYLKWELKRGESWLLRDTGKVIGSISEIPLSILIEGDERPFMYVDHLTVVKEERGKGVATKLISKGVQIGVERDVPRFIFRIEEKPLPYPYLCKLSNYYGTVNEKCIGKMNYKRYSSDTSNVDHDAIYQFWLNIVKKHKFSMIMNSDQFKKYATSNDIVTTYYWIKKGVVIGLLIGFKTLFRGESVTEIVFVHCLEGEEEIMFANINDLDTKWITIHSYSDHMKWIKKLGLKRSHDLYIHLYNFHHPRIEAKELHFGMG